MTSPSTPVASSKTSKTEISATVSSKSRQKNINDIRVCLHNNNLRMYDEEAEGYEHVLVHAKSIIRGERGSVMRPKSRKKLGEIRQTYGSRGESTFLHNTWSQLIRPERHVQGATPEFGENWYVRSWDLDNLDGNWDEEFRKGSVPALTARDDLILPERVSNPKPDITYGIKPAGFTPAQHAVNIRYNGFTEVSPALFHSFFVVEWKNAGGSVEDAENQACRGGAAIVNGLDQLKAVLAELEKKKIDAEQGPGTSSSISNPPHKRAPTPEVEQNDGLPLDTASQSDTTLPSMAFSLALQASVATIHVHWSEQKKGVTIFHMHLVRTYAIRDDEAWEHLRHDIDNILDWGVLTHKTEIQKILDDIIANTPMPETSSKGPKSGKKRKYN